MKNKFNESKEEEIIIFKNIKKKSSLITYWYYPIFVNDL